MHEKTPFKEKVAFFERRCLFSILHHGFIPWEAALDLVYRSACLRVSDIELLQELIGDGCIMDKQQVFVIDVIAVIAPVRGSHNDRRITVCVSIDQHRLAVEFAGFIGLVNGCRVRPAGIRVVDADL